MTDWHLTGAALDTRRRRGGADAQSGTEYQRTFAVMQACQMLNAPDHAVAMRWECAQDVDLKLKDGSDLYIQTKNVEAKTVSLNWLSSTLAGFALDLLDTAGKSVRFRVVMRAGNVDAAVHRLIRRQSTPEDIQVIESLLAAEDKRLENMPQKKRHSLASRLVKLIDFDTHAGEQREGVWSFEAYAERELRRYGIRDSELENVINLIYRLFVDRRELTGEELAELTRPARRTVAFMQPKLLETYVDRQRLLSSGLELLTGVGSAPVALRGMGGCGKTILATALAHDERIRQRFPDGVLWATLGQSANLSATAHSLLTALGSHSAPLDAAAGPALLRDELARRRCLVVVDDAWASEEVQSLRPGNGDSRLLFTTRDRRVCEVLRAKIIEVGPLERTESIDLLRQEVSTVQPAFDEAGADEFAERVGDLALALRLGAIQVRDGRSFAELLAAMTEATAALDELDSDTGEVLQVDDDQRRHRSLGACFDISVRTLDADVQRSFFLLAILRDDETFDAAEAQLIVAAKSEADSAKIMRLLARKALLLDFRTGERQQWHLHDLMHDHAKAAYTPARKGRYVDSLPPSLQKAHSDWLDRCRQGTDWSTCADLGYVERNLAWHAQEAGRPEIVHALMREQRNARPCWLDRLVDSRNGAQFAVDAQRAMALAHTSLVSASQSPIRCYTDLLWSAVARTSRVSKAQKSPPPLVARLVSEGALSASDGISQIRMQEPLSRVWSFGWLLPILNSANRERTETEIFEAMQDLQRLVPETSTLDAIAPHASTRLRKRLIRFAGGVSPYLHAVVLAHLLPNEPSLIDESLADFERRHTWTRASKRSCYVQLMEVGLRPPGATTETLIDLLQDPDPGILKYVSRSVAYLPDKYTIPNLDLLFSRRPDELFWVTTQQKTPLREFLREAILDRVRDVGDPLFRASLLASTASWLPLTERTAAQNEAIGILRKLPKSDWRVSLELIAASRDLKLDEKQQVQIEAWTRARDVGFDQLGASNFSDLAKYLTPDAAIFVSELMKSASTESQIRCLPHLLANAPKQLASRLTLQLTEATRNHGGYADLGPCIDAIPSDLLPTLLESSTALGPRQFQLRRLDERLLMKSMPPGAKPPATTWPLIFLSVTQESRWRERLTVADALAAQVKSMEATEKLVFFSEALVKATSLDRERLCQLLEAIAIPLSECFNEQELESIKETVEQACALYS